MDVRPLRDHAGPAAPLFANRFLPVDDGSAIDVALGHHVFLEQSHFKTREARDAWLDRSAKLHTLRHPGLAPILDFGITREECGFVAGAADAPVNWRHRRNQNLRLVESGVEFLHRLGLSAGRLTRDRIVNRAGRLSLLPDQATGWPIDEVQRAREVRLCRRLLSGSAIYGGPSAERFPVGVQLQRPTVLSIIGDWFDEDPGTGLRSVQVCGPPGSGVTTILELAVREARLRGFVTISLDWAIERSLDLATLERTMGWLNGRHTLLLTDARPWRGHPVGADRLQRQACLLARIATAHSRPLLLLIASPSPPQRGGYIEVESLSKAALRAAVANTPGPCRTAHEIDYAFRASAGLPGRFVHHLQCGASLASVRRGHRHMPATGVAESSARYPAAESSMLTLAGELEARRRAGERGIGRLEESARLMRAGRHAGADRLLRDICAAHVRRGDYFGAGCGAVLLGRLLATRGKCPIAAETFQAAQSHFERASSSSGVALAVTHLGVIRTSQGHFADAERLLRGGEGALGRTDDEECRAFAALMLARCCFWSGRFDDARRLISSMAESASKSPGPIGFWPNLRVVCLALLTRLALAERSVHAAVAEARSALDQARQANDDGSLARATLVSAEVHAHLGDSDPLREAWKSGRVAARMAREPLVGLELRLAVVNGLMNANRAAEARTLSRALGRLRLEHLPELLAARVRVVLGRVWAGSRTGSQLVGEGERFIRDAGARGVRALYGPKDGVVILETAHWVRHVIDVLTVCHDAEDERETLGQVGGLVRERTRAASVAFFAVQTDGLSVVSSAGSRADQVVAARRAVESGLSIPPGRHSHGIEAAVPIRCGATTIGALACRWIAVVPDAGTEEFLKATAAACAPSVRLVVERLRPPAQTRDRTPEIIGASEPIEDVRRAVLRAASAPFAVLVEGESGTGKELVVRAIHRLSARRDRKCATVNCAALVDDLVEAELFGHARGAFTGAVAERAGLFEEAHGGTLFLDEVTELSARAQAKLLRVIQEGEVRRVGETFSRTVDVRLISASNRPLEAEIGAGRFRCDLMYRLDVIRIVVPPLRARVEDIPILIRYFWDESCRRLGRRASLRASLIAALSRYDWPGNVRELQNVMAALAVAAPHRGTVGTAALPRALTRATSTEEGSMTLQEGRRRFEERFVRTALARAGGRRARAAADLGISRQGLSKLIGRLGLPQD